MMRLVLFVFLLAGLVLAFASVMIALRVIAPSHTSGTGDSMPRTFSTIAYVLLILLMFGVVTGWLGAA